MTIHLMKFTTFSKNFNRKLCNIKQARCDVVDNLKNVFEIKFNIKKRFEHFAILMLFFFVTTSCIRSN